MKRCFLVLAIVFAAVFANAQIIDALLLAELDNHSDDEKVEVVVTMKARYDRDVMNRKAAICATRSARRDFVVKELRTFAEASQHDIMAALDEMEQLGMVANVESLWTANALFLSANRQAVFELAKRADIECISFNKQYNCIPEEIITDAPRALYDSFVAPNIIQVNADQVWEQGYTGQGVVVAVIDSGVNYNHVDIADHLWDGGEEFPNHGFDVYNNDDDPMDDMGHGTHCAGTVCSDGTAGLVAGSAPDATLMCVKAINNEGFGGAVNFVKGMQWSVEHGCDLISMSLGMAMAEVPDKELLRHTCESLLDMGVLVVVCAGNEGSWQTLCPIPDNVRVPGSCPPPYLDQYQMANPGGLSCVITIGAVDENDTAAFFTSQGPVTWQNTEFGDYAYDPGIGLIRPDVCAPGVMIWSLKYDNIYDYDYKSGTSQATPCVAGVVALMLQKNPELMPADIYRILEESALKLTPEKSVITGVGHIDALAAIEMLDYWAVAENHADEIMVYPNPANDIVNVVGDFETIELMDINGQLMDVDVKNGMIDVSHLPNGIYFLKSDNYSKKLIIQK